jgi:hypothetical protein
MAANHARAPRTCLLGALEPVDRLFEPRDPLLALWQPASG